MHFCYCNRHCRCIQTYNKHLPVICFLQINLDKSNILQATGAQLENRTSLFWHYLLTREIRQLSWSTSFPFSAWLCCRSCLSLLIISINTALFCGPGGPYNFSDFVAPGMTALNYFSCLKWEHFMNCLLTHYHTMPHFDALKIYSCGKHREKRRNCLEQPISPFLTMFSTLYGTDFYL